MVRVYSTVVRRVLFLAFLAVLAGAAPVLADVTWNLSGVSLANGGSVAGWFTYDPAGSGSIPTWALTIDFPNPPQGIDTSPLTLTQSTSTASDTATATLLQYGSPNDANIHFSGYRGNDSYYVYLEYAGLTTALGGSGLITLDGDRVYEYSAGFGSGPIGITAGELTTVPLPPSAFLLATGLLGLVGLRRFRKI